MTALPTLPSVVAVGDTGTANWAANQVAQWVAFLAAPPTCQVWGNTAQSIPNNTTTSVLFDQENIDTSGMHSTVTNTSRVTAVYPGKYLVSAKATFATNSTGGRQGLLALNGTQVSGSSMNQPPSASGGVTLASTFVVQMAVGDYVEFQVIQASGSALALVTATAAMAAVWIGS